MKNKKGKQTTKISNPDVRIPKQVNAHPFLKFKKMERIKTNWIMTTVSAVALVLGVFLLSNAVEKELPKKEVIETVKAQTLITFSYVAPNVTNPYHADHVSNPENWQVLPPNCPTSLNPNAPCSIEVALENTVDEDGTEIDTDKVTLRLTNIDANHNIIDDPSSGDNYENPINTEKP